jgi:hypothetical protein
MDNGVCLVSTSALWGGTGENTSTNLSKNRCSPGLKEDLRSFKQVLPEINLLLICHWVKFWFVTVFPKYSKSIYCTLASCYIRLTLNICSFVCQCNTFRENKHVGKTINMAAAKTTQLFQQTDTDNKHNIRSSTWLATSHRRKLA